MNSLLPPSASGTPPFDLACVLVATAVAATGHRTARNVTDWPFEHFWSNPSEPSHSNLLGWFLNPHAGHGCGSFLLESFLRFLQEGNALPRDRSFPVDGCRVLSETAYMDLRIERQRPDGKFVVLFENKINGAADQHLQLSYYVGQLLSSGFSPEEIFVLYAPRGPGRQPAVDDVADLRQQKVHWSITPFSTHILPWLDSVLDPKPSGENPLEQPASLEGGMRENLAYYRKLLCHLTYTEQPLHMSREIFEQLRSATAIPTLQDLDRSTEIVRACIMTLLRARLFLQAQGRLRERGEDARFYDHQGQEFSPPLTADVDERFGHEVNLGLQVGSAVHVCYGGYQEERSGYNFWTGYMRSGDDAGEQARLEALVKVVCGYNNPNVNGPWYAWDYNRSVHHGNCSEPSSTNCMVDTLLEMRQRLLQHLEIGKMAEAGGSTP